MAEGFVYFLQAEIGGPIKIGCSFQPRQRLIDMMAWSPFPLMLLASGEGSMATEAALHQMFASDRSHGEWFRPSAALLALIDEVKSTGRVPRLGIELDMSWKVGGFAEWRSNLDPLLARINCSRTDLARAVGAHVSNVHYWSTENVPDRRIASVVRFFVERGLHVTPRDLFIRRQKRRAA